MCIAVVGVDGEVFKAVHEDAASEVAVIYFILAVCIACATAKGTEVEAEGFAGEGVDRWEDAECVAVFFAVGF